MLNNTKAKDIPGFVSQWTDEYFHKSAFDMPIKYPNKRVIGFLSQFKKMEEVVLYRGVNQYNKENNLITSWTYNKNIALGYIKEGGRIIKRKFDYKNILLDTTILSPKQKKLLGYDYEVDDAEVLILEL